MNSSGTQYIEINSGAKSAVAAAIDFLGPDTLVKAIEKNSNFNYLYCCYNNNTNYYLKISQHLPKKLDVTLPRERIFSEIESIKIFRKLSENLIETPRILMVDQDNYCFLMTDIGSNKANLADVINTQFDLYAKGIGSMAEAVAKFHLGTRGKMHICPKKQSDRLREFIYNNLINVGIKSISGDKANSVLNTMYTTRECLIHSDLWCKNMLIDSRGLMGLVDYEGTIDGDPAFDLATILAAGLFPIFQSDVSFSLWDKCSANILSHYKNGLTDNDWYESIVNRIPHYLAVMIAARIAGPFSYEMDNDWKMTLKKFCLQIIDNRLLNWDELVHLLRVCVSQQLNSTNT